MIKTYVEFDLPGAFFSESVTREVARRDFVGVSIPPKAYACHFYDVSVGEVDGRPVRSASYNRSPRHFLNGDVFSRAEVERMSLPTLAANMRSNGWDRVVRCRTGNWQPFEADDVLVRLVDEAFSRDGSS